MGENDVVLLQGIHIPFNNRGRSGIHKYIDYFSDAEGNESEELPSTEVIMTFKEQEGKTKLVSRSKYTSAEALKTVLDMGMEQGISETWDRLEEHLQSIQ